MHKGKNLTPPHPQCKIFITSTGTMIRKVSVQYHSMVFDMDIVCWSELFLCISNHRWKWMVGDIIHSIR